MDNKVAIKLESMSDPFHFSQSSAAQSPQKSALSPASAALMWFRRDLRMQDNAALYHALKEASQQGAGVYGVFVFDVQILHALPRLDRRVEFIHASLQALHEQMQRASGGRAHLLVLHGQACDEIPRLALELGVSAVYANHDDEPQAIQRDAHVAQVLRTLGVAFRTHKDHVIFERQEVLTQAGKPFTVFTPYKNAWLKKRAAGADDFFLKPYPTEKYVQALQTVSPALCQRYALPSLADLGFGSTNLVQLGIQTGSQGAKNLLADFLPRMHRYQQARDYPALKGPSYLSVHLRFGTVSIRTLAAACAQAQGDEDASSPGAATWLSELIWRDFYHQIMANFAHAMHGSFKPEYDRIEWEQGALAQERYSAWTQACTGYPLVDAAMRQLAQTGYMHNRLRMVVASFLTKDLGLDWRWGERYFAQQLIDFDLAANNGGWQWAASSGCDAQPYFRIFNPITQSQKFDPQGKFIRRYMPELAHLDDQQIHLPQRPIVDHAQARARTLERYAVVKAAQPQ